ncbi:MAG: Na+ dependent nucleoside transporter N-terminal domain-containing protein [Candidatus Midichloria sp.]
MSEDKKSFSWKVVSSGVFLQFAIAAFLIKIPVAASSLLIISRDCRRFLILDL